MVQSIIVGDCCLFVFLFILMYVNCIFVSVTPICYILGLAVTEHEDKSS